MVYKMKIGIFDILSVISVPVMGEMHKSMQGREKIFLAAYGLIWWALHGHLHLLVPQMM